MDMQIRSLVTTKLLHFLIRLSNISYSFLAFVISLLGKILNIDARYVKVAQEITLGFLFIFLGLATTLVLAIAEHEIIYKRLEARKHSPAPVTDFRLLPEPLTSFELFPDLPEEIRRMIVSELLHYPLSCLEKILSVLLICNYSTSSCLLFLFPGTEMK
jgi:hypothetical protein